MKPIYPDVKVQLSNEDGNAYNIMAKVGLALRRGGHVDQVKAYQAEAKSGDYDNLLRVTMKWVTVL